MRKGFLTVLLLVLLTACGSSDGGLDTKNLAIHKVNDDKAVVKYGMSRADAEKVLGTGEEVGFGNSFSYTTGVQVAYRENTVAGIYLSKGSEDVYETADGLRVGMMVEEAKNIYGDQYLNDNERNLDYAYDTDNGEFLKETEWAKKFDDDSKIYLISVMFAGDGKARMVMLTDRQMAMTFR